MKIRKLQTKKVFLLLARGTRYANLLKMHQLSVKSTSTVELGKCCLVCLQVHIRLARSSKNIFLKTHQPNGNLSSEIGQEKCLLGLFIFRSEFALGQCVFEIFSFFNYLFLVKSQCFCCWCSYSAQDIINLSVPFTATYTGT